MGRTWQSKQIQRSLSQQHEKEKPETKIGRHPPSLTLEPGNQSKYEHASDKKMTQKIRDIPQGWHCNLATRAIVEVSCQNIQREEQGTKNS